MSEGSSAFTVIEVLIVVSILAIITVVGFVNLRPATARVLAADIKSMMHQARYEAVRLNQPVAVVWVEGERRFETRVNSGSTLVTAACNGNSVIAGKSVTEYPRADVSVNMATNGLVWLPTGQGRSCTGGPMVSSTVTVSDGNTSRIVEITMGGKVSIE